MFKIDFQPVGRRGHCAKDQSLLDCARHLNVDIVSICGGVGTCGRCKVQIAAGLVSKPSLDEEAELSPEELAKGYRLACQVFPLGDVSVNVPPESLTAVQRTQVEGLNVDVEPEPATGTAGRGRCAGDCAVPFAFGEVEGIGVKHDRTPARLDRIRR